MKRLESVENFHAFQDRLTGECRPDIPTLIIPAGTCGKASGADGLIEAAHREIEENGLGHRVHVRVTGCHGFCEMEPSVLVEPSRTFYPKVGPEAMKRIVLATAAGEVIEDLL
ncbi:MAG: NADP-reducing hydrogenase subunit HndC, partial [Candidatus Hydrogenedentes bacterium]|nr:NADP-reducing hydrogenase subunit HndC [Candidatus Hydrogenedentota bacterium]